VPLSAMPQQTETAAPMAVEPAPVSDATSSAPLLASTAEGPSAVETLVESVLNFFSPILTPAATRGQDAVAAVDTAAEPTLSVFRPPLRGFDPLAPSPIFQTSGSNRKARVAASAPWVPSDIYPESDNLYDAPPFPFFFPSLLLSARLQSCFPHRPVVEVACSKTATYIVTESRSSLVCFGTVPGFAQPMPRALPGGQGIRVSQVSCGQAHTLLLSEGTFRHS
jgi:hypothetical protein